MMMKTARGAGSREEGPGDQKVDSEHIKSEMANKGLCGNIMQGGRKTSP